MIEPEEKKTAQTQEKKRSQDDRMLVKGGRKEPEDGMDFFLQLETRGCRRYTKTQPERSAMYDVADERMPERHHGEHRLSGCGMSEEQPSRGRGISLWIYRPGYVRYVGLKISNAALRSHGRSSHHPEQLQKLFDEKRQRFLFSANQKVSRMNLFLQLGILDTMS
jgi:hypothetical protein